MRLFLDLEWMFDRLSHEYSFKVFQQDKHPILNFTTVFLKEVLRKDFRVLDLGCGDGIISNNIAKLTSKVVGIDHNCNAIENAKVKFKRDNLEFICGEARDYLRNNKEHFDVLFLSHILEHIDNPKDFLLEFKPYFNYIYIELPDFDKAYLNQYRVMLGNKLVFTDNDHVSEFDREELNQLLEEAGIEIIKANYRFGFLAVWCRII